jgi:hypothetical protein
MKITATKDLSGARAAAIEAVNAQAEIERQKWITPGAGQAMVYQAKAAEATAFLARYATQADAASATASDWPMISAEVGITASDLWGVASTIVAIQTQWLAVAAQIETARLGAKAQIDAAVSLEAIAAVPGGITWPSPS